MSEHDTRLRLTVDEIPADRRDFYAPQIRTAILLRNHGLNEIAATIDHDHPCFHFLQHNSEHARTNSQAQAIKAQYTASIDAIKQNFLDEKGTEKQFSALWELILKNDVHTPRHHTLLTSSTKTLHHLTNG